MKPPITLVPGTRTARYKDVRSLSRGLAVLRALNRAPGGLSTIAEISAASGVHRTTAKRLLETLRQEGLVRLGERNGQYCLTFKIRSLCEGFEEEDWIAEVARPQMKAAVPKLLWPCDLATIEGGFVVIRESTHRWSTLSQHRAMIGERMPVFVTALGRAWLAHADPAEREEVMRLMAMRNDWVGALARNQREVARLVRATLKKGYGYNDGEYLPDPQFSAFALPVRSRGKTIAAINLVFPKSAITEREFRARFLPILKDLCQRIGKGSEAWL